VPVRRRYPSLIDRSLTRNGANELVRGPLVEVPLAGRSQIVRRNGSRVWCARYAGLEGIFRKDLGPSKELGRALCDEVRERFGCDGFLTTDELPRYGIGRREARAIRSSVGAADGDCVFVYAYDEPLARGIDDFLHSRLHTMLEEWRRL